MSKWIVVEIKDDESKRVLDGEYNTWDEACEVQIVMERLHDENSYLIYTNDEWMYEIENGRV